MDRQLSAQHIRKQKNTRLRWIVGSILALSILLLGFRMLLQPVIHRETIETVIAGRGDVAGSVAASGTILPEFEEVIGSPVTSTITRVLHNVGETVQAHEVILQLDKTAEALQLSKMTEELASKENQKKRLELNIEATLIDLETNLQIQQLKGTSLQTKYENEKYLKTLGGTTEESVKQAELESKIASLELDHLRQNIINKKAQLQTELKEQELAISIYKKDLEEVCKKLKDSDVKATSNGVITSLNDKIGSTVVQGSELIRLSNLESFKIQGSISEVYLKKMNLGSKVLLQINDVTLSGKVISINPTVQNDAVKFTVMPEIRNHPALSSNKKVDLMIVTSYRKNVVRIPKSALQYMGSSPYLFIIQGDYAIRRTVRLGESSFDYTEVISGLDPGDQVITSDIQEYIHLEKIKIN